MGALSEIDVALAEAGADHSINTLGIGENMLPQDVAAANEIPPPEETAAVVSENTGTVHGLTEAGSQGLDEVGADNTVPMDTPAQEPQSVEDTEEEEKQAEHEAIEARRKAEWEEKRQEKRAAEKAQIDEIKAMTDEEITSNFAGRLRNQTEILTRRNMKFYVTAYLQSLGTEKTDFARLTMNPKKSMANCFRYIQNRARDFVSKEMEANGERLEGEVVEDVPDYLCYQWAQDYFYDLNAKEDKVPEEKFVPHPYAGNSGAKKRNSAKKKEEKPVPKETTAKKPAKKPDVEGQLSLDTLSSTGVA